MQWLLTSHVRRYHNHSGSSGHVWQGRSKSFPVECDEHLLIVMRDVSGDSRQVSFGAPVNHWP